jgi:hypothetical protein
MLLLKLLGALRLEVVFHPLFPPALGVEGGGGE